MVMGTAGYMSPEQVRGEPVDARSDIFSFGCVLYEMIAGRRAFQARSSVETMHAILNEDPPELESGSCSPALGTIARRCLEKRPEQRFQSAADLAFALRALTPGSSSAPAHSPIATPSRRWKPWVAAFAAGLALFAAGYVARTWTARPTLHQFQRITFRKGFIDNARFTPTAATSSTKPVGKADHRIFISRFPAIPTRAIWASRLLAVYSRSPPKKS
jgi:serine/threonine protein kinase